jgi:hypothetical protein
MTGLALALIALMGLISEMNFYFNGGGWGRVSYRYAHSGAGVAFVY